MALASPVSKFHGKALLSVRGGDVGTPFVDGEVTDELFAVADLLGAFERLLIEKVRVDEEAC